MTAPTLPHPDPEARGRSLAPTFVRVERRVERYSLLLDAGTLSVIAEADKLACALVALAAVASDSSVTPAENALFAGMVVEAQRYLAARRQHDAERAEFARQLAARNRQIVAANIEREAADAFNA
jgi:hypothetical protein